MATETITNITALPTYLEAPAAAYVTQLQNVTGKLKDADLSGQYGSQFVAGQDPLQAQAQQIAQQGIGAYQPFLKEAGALQGQAAGQLGLAGTLQGQAGTLAGQASQYMGPNAYQQFMSPYQKDVIDTTLAEFDVQAQKGMPGLAAQAINAGAFGGGREGVQRAEYQQSSDRNRAALQAQLLGQAFGQAQQAAGQAFGQQQSMASQQGQLAQSALGLGQAYSGLGQQQLGLGQAGQSFLGQDVGALSTLGAQNQALTQAQLSAQQQLAQQQMNQPLMATQQLGSGITGLVAGYPGGIQTQTQPSPTGLQTALGAGATLAGIYGAFKGFGN
jgi:hypothetical protein